MINKAQVLATSWEQLKRKLKLHFGGLLYADLAYAENRQDLMFRNLQIKLGKSKEDFDKIVAAL